MSGASDFCFWIGEFADSNLPRFFDPNRPQLVLGRCQGDPLAYIERLNTGQEGYKSAFAVEHGINPRMDLFENLPDDLKVGAEPTHASFKTRRRAIHDYLVDQGYVVDGYWGIQVYTVYVIDLSDEVPSARVRPKGWIYVGETSRTREERYKTHVAGGYQANSWVTKYHLGFNEELCARYPQVRTRQDSEALEKHAATELEAEGWNVRWGSWSLSQDV